MSVVDSFVLNTRNLIRNEVRVKLTGKNWRRFEPELEAESEGAKCKFTWTLEYYFFIFYLSNNLSNL